MEIPFERTNVWPFDDIVNDAPHLPVAFNMLLLMLRGHRRKGTTLHLMIGLLFTAHNKCNARGHCLGDSLQSNNEKTLFILWFRWETMRMNMNSEGWNTISSQLISIDILIGLLSSMHRIEKLMMIDEQWFRAENYYSTFIDFHWNKSLISDNFLTCDIYFEVILQSILL